jgi:hypothetical protein
VKDNGSSKRAANSSTEPSSHAKSPGKALPPTGKKLPHPARRAHKSAISALPNKVGTAIASCEPTASLSQ